ncbi:glutathione binding-like protein [Niveibacterium sp. 24ML]|uniref:glutathione S-transferase family protein n=1 Tax=Niveibacterium sp. 24ML TaxID=2985512 RepID=UPI00226D5659|nr:glutathione binding-like protein [Niveibacterium sp. 24ML]MCX9156243.1 glutathione binding-like protein [Niveibacterium sp. 24ML]
MLTLFTWGTPNGQKVSIMLEECGLRYSVKPIDLGAGEQFDPDFLALNPNNKIPLLQDDEGPDGSPITLFESGAILVYLAGKCGQFLPASAHGRYETLQWLMFQMASLGPMLGQAHHFLRFAPEAVPYAMKRYGDEARRLYRVLETRLEGREWIAADLYTIADIAAFPWIACHEYQQIDLAHYPNVQAWFDRIAARPAVQRGLKVPK